MGQNVQIGDLADAIMETLEEYADLAADNVKQAVKDAGETVKKEIRANAPKDTGDYAKSWAVKARLPLLWVCPRPMLPVSARLVLRKL